MTFVELKDVKKIYVTGEVETKALSGINFEVEKGELCVVVGPSGAGKSTVLNLLGGMDSPTSGTIVVDGKHIESFSDRQLTMYRRNEIGFIFQFYNLVQNLTALENVELATEICKDHFDPVQTLKQVGLADRMDHFPAQMSGGEQQRVAIARALAKNPKLLLCDEPTGALDSGTGRQILALLQQTCRETGMTVIIITHNSSIVPMGDRVIRVKNGQVTEQRVNPAPLSVDQIEW